MLRQRVATHDLSIYKMRTEIVTALNQIPVHLVGAEASANIRRVAIKDALVKLGHKIGFRVAASEINNADEGEWLYDVSWKAIENGRLRSLPAVFEIELGRDPTDTAKDFGKMLPCKADLCVMVYDAVLESRVVSIRNALKDRIKAFDHPPAHAFLLIWLNKREGLFQHEFLT